MKTFYPLLMIFCIAAFASCTEEIEVQPKEITAEAYLENIEQPILFQIVQLDANDTWEAGWVIDDKGNIHEFSINGRLAQNQEDMNCPGSFVMESLLNYTDGIVGTVDLEELVNNHKSLKTIKLAGTEDYVPTEQSNLAFFGLLKTRQASHYLNNCGTQSLTDANGSTTYRYHSVDYILLDKFTTEGQRSLDPTAAGIVNWMQLIDEEL